MKVAFIGHRNVKETEALKERLSEVLTTLIENENADTFLFGSRSAFNDICYEIVSHFKGTYPHIKRIFVRAEYDYDFKSVAYLLENYEETFFPDRVRGAGELSYVVRNQVLADMCDVLIVYCDVNYNLPRKKCRNAMLEAVYAHRHNKSGTKMAMSYAQQKKKQIINVFEQG